MANVEGENPNFDELKTLGEDAAAMEPLLEDEASLESDAETEVETGLAEGLEAVTEDEAIVESADEVVATEKGRGATSLYVGAGAAIGLPAVVAVLFLLNVIFLSTAIYLVGLCYIPLGLWLGRLTNTVFTVFLGCTLAALMTASFCLWVELGRYEFDMKAKDARVSAILPAGTELLAQHEIAFGRLDA